MESSEWELEAAWANTRLPLGKARALDAATYVDERFFASEQRQVFERGWVCVAIADEVAKPGQVVARRLGSRPIIVTRDTTGELRSFLNSCRHRGTQLVASDCNVASTLRCPYHRWGYALDGRLVATPLFEPQEPVEQLALHSVRVEQWGCLIFACLDESTPDLATWLGDLPERMAGYRLERWRTQEAQEIDIAANWKLISENFQEYYHLTWIHPELAKVSRVDDHYRYQGPGMYCGQTTTPVSGEDRDDWLVLPPASALDRSDAASGRFVAIFPNVLLSVLPNHVFVMRLDPLEPGRTRETCTWLLPEGTETVSEDDFEATRTFWLEVNDEDIGIVERGQRGLRSRVAPGPLVPRFEEPLHRFHNMLADMVTVDDISKLEPPAGDRPGADGALGGSRNPNPPVIELQL